MRIVFFSCCDFSTTSSGRFRGVVSRLPFSSLGFSWSGARVFRVKSFFRVPRWRIRLRQIQILSVPIIVRFVNAKYKNVIFASKRIRFFPGRVGGRSRYFGGLFVVISLTQSVKTIFWLGSFRFWVFSVREVSESADCLFIFDVIDLSSFLRSFILE